MADLNPVTAWRRLLALPNESRTKTLAMAFLVALVCTLMVTGATVILRPIQAANRAAEQQARLEAFSVGFDGRHAGGILAAGENAVCVTAEILMLGA